MAKLKDEPVKKERKKPEPEKQLPLHELMKKTETSKIRTVGALVAGGHQKEMNEEINKPHDEQRPFLTATEFKKLVNKYEKR